MYQSQDCLITYIQKHAHSIYADASKDLMVEEA